MRLAAIDIGSNSIHMVITATNRTGGTEILDREKEMVKLGAGVFRTHELNQAAFERGCKLSANMRNWPIVTIRQQSPTSQRAATGPQI